MYTAGCQTGCTTRFDNRFDNQLYRANGVLVISVGYLRADLLLHRTYNATDVGKSAQVEQRPCIGSPDEERMRPGHWFVSRSVP